MKSSEDHGRSWSDSVCVARGDEHATEVRRIAYGDPSLVADRTSNEVLLHCVAGNMGYQRATRDNPQIGRSTRLNSSHANISYAVFCLKNTTVILVDVRHSYQLVA